MRKAATVRSMASILRARRGGSPDQLPVAVLDAHQYTGTLVDAGVVRWAHAVDAMRAHHVPGAFQRVPQGLPELRAARLGLLRGSGDGGIREKVGVPRIGGKGVARAGTESALVRLDELQRDLLDRIAVRQLLGHHHRPGRGEGTLDALSADPQ